MFGEQTSAQLRRGFRLSKLVATLAHCTEQARVSRRCLCRFPDR